MRLTFPLATIPPTLTVFYSLFFRLFIQYRYGDREPSRAQNVTLFSILLSLSFTGALGLSIRAASSSDFYEEFRSSHPGDRLEGGLALSMSWISVFIREFRQPSSSPPHGVFSPIRLAMIGILASWSEKHPKDLEARRLYSGQRPFELQGYYSGQEPTTARPGIYMPRPPLAAYTAARSRQLNRMERTEAQTLARVSPSRLQRVQSHTAPPPPPKITEPMLGRKVNGPVGESLRKQYPYPPISPEDDAFPIRVDAWKAQEKKRRFPFL